MVRKQEIGLCFLSVSSTNRHSLGTDIFELPPTFCNEQAAFSTVELSRAISLDLQTSVKVPDLCTHPRALQANSWCQAKTCDSPLVASLVLGLHGKVTNSLVLTQSWVSRVQTKIVDSLHLFQKLSIAVPFAGQFLWPKVHERGFAKWSEMQYTTPLVIGLNEAAVSAMQRLCFDVSHRFRTQFVFGWEVLRERHPG